jgi:hypothetical protein
MPPTQLSEHQPELLSPKELRLHTRMSFRSCLFARPREFQVVLCIATKLHVCANMLGRLEVRSAARAAQISWPVELPALRAAVVPL